MFSTLKNAFKVKEIRAKLLNMLIVLVIVRLGTFIPVPGININALHNAGASDTLYSLITGGNYE